MPNAHKTLHQKKVAPCLHSSLSFGKNSLFLHCLELPRTTCNLPVNIILSSFGTRPLSLPLPLPFSLACEGSLSHSETSKYYLPRALRLFLPLPQAEGLECVCPCTVPLSPTYIECTSHPACRCVSDTKHLQQKGCSTGLKRTFSLGCIFLCLGPWISVLPAADHPDPTGPLSAPASMGVDRRQNGPPILNTAPTNLPPKVCLTAH